MRRRAGSSAPVKLGSAAWRDTLLGAKGGRGRPPGSRLRPPRGDQGQGLPRGDSHHRPVVREAHHLRRPRTTRPRGEHLWEPGSPDEVAFTLPSIIHETLMAVVVQYNASQLITHREALSKEIKKILTERAKNFNIALDDVSITNLSFGKEFIHAIEARQVAAQEAERAKFIVEKAGQDRKVQLSGHWTRQIVKSLLVRLLPTTLLLSRSDRLRRHGDRPHHLKLQQVVPGLEPPTVWPPIAEYLG